MKSQEHVQWQEQDSRCQIEDQDFQARKEIYNGLHNRVQNIGYKGGYRQVICYLLIKKECASGYYQDNIGIPTDSNVRDTQRMEGSNYLSKTRIWVHRRMTQLQNRIRNNI